MTCILCLHLFIKFWLHYDTFHLNGPDHSILSCGPNAFPEPNSLCSEPLTGGWGEGMKSVGWLCKSQDHSERELQAELASALLNSHQETISENVSMLVLYDHE